MNTYYPPHDRPHDVELSPSAPDTSDYCITQLPGLHLPETNCTSAPVHQSTSAPLHQSTRAPPVHIVHTSNNTSTHRTLQKCHNRKTLPFTLWLAHWTNCVFTKFPFLLNPAQCCTVWGRNEITQSVFMETLALHNAQTHSLQCSMHNFYKAQCTNTIRIAQCTIRNAQVHNLQCAMHNAHCKYIMQTIHCTPQTVHSHHLTMCTASQALLIPHSAVFSDCVFMVTLALLLTIARYSQKLDHRDLDQMTLGGNRML